MHYYVDNSTAWFIEFLCQEVNNILFICVPFSNLVISAVTDTRDRQSPLIIRKPWQLHQQLESSCADQSSLRGRSLTDIDQLQACFWILLCVSAILIAARLWLRLKIQHQALLLSDALLLIAWCSSFTHAVFVIIFAVKGALHPDIDYTLINWKVDVTEVEFITRVKWGTSLGVPSLTLANVDDLVERVPVLHVAVLLQVRTPGNISTAVPKIYEEVARGSLCCHRLLCLWLSCLYVCAAVPLLANRG